MGVAVAMKIIADAEHILGPIERLYRSFRAMKLCDLLVEFIDVEGLLGL